MQPLSGQYPRGHRELRGSFFRTHGPKETAQWFEARGVALKVCQAILVLFFGPGKTVIEVRQNGRWRFGQATGCIGSDYFLEDFLEVPPNEAPNENGAGHIAWKKGHELSSSPRWFSIHSIPDISGSDRSEVPHRQ